MARKEYHAETYVESWCEIMAEKELVTVCSWCETEQGKKDNHANIKQADGTWQWGNYPSGALLSHGICPDCYEELKKTIPTHKVEEIGVTLCRECGEEESPNKMKQGKCIYCQPCSHCEKVGCDKAYNRDLGVYLCSDCAYDILTIEQRRQEAREALV